MRTDCDLILQHLPDGNAGPGGDDVANDLRIDADADERRFPLDLFELGVQLDELGAQRRGIESRLRGRCLGIAGGSGRRRTGSFEFRAHFANTRDEIALFFPALAHGGELGFGLGAVAGDFLEALLVVRAQRGFALENARLDGQIVERAGGVFDGRRNGVLAERQPRTRGIEHADGLVGKLAIGQIAVRELHRRCQSVIQDADIVMLFEHGNEAAQHHAALFFGRLFHLDDLEAARQGGVLLEVFLVFGPRGGGDGAQLATREGRFQQVGGIILARLAARADHGVGFIDEQNDGSRRAFDFLDQSFEPIFEFAFHARAGLQEREIERAQRYVLQHRGNVAMGDAQREALHDGGFADARFAGEDRIVLAAAREDVDHLADFGVAAQYGVDLAAFRAFSKVDGVLIEIGRFAAAGARLAGARGSRAWLLGSGGDGVLVRACDDLQQVLPQGVGLYFLQLLTNVANDARQIVVREQRQDGESRTDLAGAVVDRSEQPGFGQHVHEHLAEHGATAVTGLHTVEAARQLSREARRVDAKMFQNMLEVAIGFVEQFRQVVLDLDLIVAARSAQPHRRFHGIARDLIDFSEEEFPVLQHRVLKK